MNEIATQHQKPTFSLTPTSISEAMEFAQVLSKSNLVPKDYQGNPGNCIIAMQWGAEIGLQPLQAMQSIAVINGRPSIWGDAMLALVRGSGALETMSESLEEGDTVAVCTVKRRGEPAATRRFSVEDAKRAGLTGKQGPWTQYPKRMLQLRARAFALRDVFPDVLRGVYIAEEAQDMPREVNMGMAEQVPPPAIAAPQPTSSRADKVRGAAAKAKALPAPSLDDVLTAINTAPSMQALKAAAEDAAHLPTDDAKGIARDAYAARKAVLMGGQMAAADAETGEVPAPSQPAGLAEHADFLAEMDGAE